MPYFATVYQTVPPKNVVNDECLTEQGQFITSSETIDAHIARWGKANVPHIGDGEHGVAEGF